MDNISLPFTELQLRTAFLGRQIEAPELGWGAFKVAYLVENDDGPSVLKILTDPIEVESEEDSLNSALPDRFLRELQGMSAVQSDHVVKILEPPEVRTIGDHRFVVYEEPYYPGGTLEKRLQSGPLSSDDAEILIKALLRGVRDLWDQQKIVHRDIKPGNIVYDRYSRPILLDLGIALYTKLSTLTETHLTSPRTVIYAAPEQFVQRRFAKIDYRTDLFQIGIVGYESLAGIHPFMKPGTKYLEEYEKQLLGSEGPDMSRLDCPQELKDVLSRLLEKSPNRRYRSISQALQVLGEVS